MFISYSDVVLPLVSQYCHFIFFLRFIYLTLFDQGGSLFCTGLFLVEVSRGYSSFQCMVFSLHWLLLYRAQDLGTQTSVVVCMDLVVPWYVGSSGTRDQTGVPCITR